MAGTAKRTDPDLWDKVKAEITRGDKGGDPGEWSARKAQLAVQQYKKAGGGYEGRKAEDNHLTQWTREDWGTKSGKESGETGERYLPKKAREKLTDAEYARTTAKKRHDSAAGKQFSAQPSDVASKTAAARGDSGKGKTAKARGSAAGKPGGTKPAAKTPTRGAAGSGAKKPAAARKTPAARSRAASASRRNDVAVPKSGGSGEG